MRITGPAAYKEYSRRYGRLNPFDQEIADMLADGEIEFDPETEYFYITDIGMLIYQEGCIVER